MMSYMIDSITSRRVEIAMRCRRSSPSNQHVPYAMQIHATRVIRRTLRLTLKLKPLGDTKVLFVTGKDDRAPGATVAVRAQFISP